MCFAHNFFVRDRKGGGELAGAKHRNEVQPWIARPFFPVTNGENGHALNIY